MIPRYGSRLAIIVVLLVLQSLIFGFELLIFTRPVRKKSWYRPLRQVFPVSITLLMVILIPLMFANAGKRQDDAAEQCSASVDGDIAGQGAQIAVWAQVGVLLILSVLGSFHTSATGAKEVGAGLMLTHGSLAIALLAQMRLGTLSSADAIVGSMILDAQNVGLSIQLAAKETLAARWQVRCVVLVQTFGLVVIPLLVSNFSRGEFANNDCRCLTVFWWAWLSDCGSTAVREMPVFWTYYACRCMGFIQASFHALYNTSKFDEAEKSERPVADIENKVPDMDAVDEEQQVGIGPQLDIDRHPNQARNDAEGTRVQTSKYTSREIRLRRVTHQYRRRNGQVVCFREYPATVTLMYTMYGALSLTSMSTVQTTVVTFNLKSASPIDSVGQIISLIVAAATLGRAAWLLFMLFCDEARSGNFVWPLKWDVNDDLLLMLTVKDHVFCSPPVHDPDILSSISLGALLTEPFDPTSKVGAAPDVPEEVERSNRSNVPIDVYPKTTVDAFATLGHMASSGVSASFGYRNHTYKRRLSANLLSSTKLLAPDLKTYEFRDPQGAANGEQGLYMVTGVMIAKGLTEHHSSLFGEGAHIASEITSGSDVLLAYRLHIVRWSRSKGAFVLEGVYDPEEDW